MGFIVRFCLNLPRDEHHFFYSFLRMIATLAENKNFPKEEKTLLLHVRGPVGSVMCSCLLRRRHHY
jgi:hypothetical protein